MTIKTSDAKTIEPFLKRFRFPEADSHKGQNGRILVIGGSSLFHAASIWAAEIASYFVDMVHYSSTKENNEIFLSLKKKFRSGIVVSREHLFDYVEEDNSVLVGPGMVRGDNEEVREGKKLIGELITKFPDRRFVFDAGALQTMEAEWLKKLKQPAIVTPQAKEFETLFGVSLEGKSQEEKVKIVEQKAGEFNCLILLKTVFDVVSDGKQTFVIEGGNAGLTKGGTGDILAGLTTAFYTKNSAIDSAVLASYLLKKTAEGLYLKQGYWYNIRTIIDNIPEVFADLSKKAL